MKKYIISEVESVKCEGSSWHKVSFPLPDGDHCNATLPPVLLIDGDGVEDIESWTDMGLRQLEPGSRVIIIDPPTPAEEPPEGRIIEMGEKKTFVVMEVDKTTMSNTLKNQIAYVPHGGAWDDEIMWLKPNRVIDGDRLRMGFVQRGDAYFCDGGELKTGTQSDETNKLWRYILDPPTPAEEPKFKVKDRVICVMTVGGKRICDDVGTITAIEDNPPIPPNYVEWDDGLGGSYRDLDLEPAPEPEPKFQVGDRVRHITALCIGTITGVFDAAEDFRYIVRYDFGADARVNDDDLEPAPEPEETLTTPNPERIGTIKGRFVPEPGGITKAAINKAVNGVISKMEITGEGTIDAFGHGNILDKAVKAAEDDPDYKGVESPSIQLHVGRGGLDGYRDTASEPGDDNPRIIERQDRWDVYLRGGNTPAHTGGTESVREFLRVMEGDEWDGMEPTSAYQHDCDRMSEREDWESWRKWVRDEPWRGNHDTVEAYAEAKTRWYMDMPCCRCGEGE